METVIEGYKICYKETGAGKKVVIILQGWGTNLEVYNPVADCINSKYRVIQLDFPGFGNSDEPKEAWSVDNYADFIIKFAKKLGLEEVILIGHSYGGRVIIKLVSRERLPFSVERIVLIDSAGILPKRTFMQNIKIKKYKVVKKIVNLKIIYSLFPNLIDEWKNKQGSEDYRNSSPIMRQCLVKAVNEDLTGSLSDIKVETLLIWGDNDTATPLSDGKLMEEMIPLAGLAVIYNAGHFCFLDQPIVFANIMRSFFQIGVGEE